MTRLWFATGTHHCELIHKFGVGDHQVNRGRREILLLRSELSKEIAIAGMQCPQEEHHLEDWWKSNRRPRQSPQVALKPGSKLVKTLLIALSVIKEGEKGSE